ncbi:MAG: sugar transferase, partial [Crocinitomicaceae bacterium]|nr:sugar transferase [Crocinitomicaceae bacterium]
LSGIGSIIFRDEEKLLTDTTMDKSIYYAQYISPYKGELELWYQKHISFKTDVILIFLTVWVIIFSESQLPFKLFKDLPTRNF